MTLTVSTYQHVLVLKYHSINRVRYWTNCTGWKINYFILFIYFKSSLYCSWNYLFYTVLRIRDVYPGSWFLSIPDPGSKKQQQQRGVKKFVVLPIFVATKITKFNKRLEFFAVCYSQSLLLADFKGNHTILSF